MRIAKTVLSIFGSGVEHQWSSFGLKLAKVGIFGQNVAIEVKILVQISPNWYNMS
jgi:hypothetical protein